IRRTPFLQWLGVALFWLGRPACDLQDSQKSCGSHATTCTTTHTQYRGGRGRPAGWRPTSARRALLPTLGHRANIHPLVASRGGMFNAAGLLYLVAYRSPVSVPSFANELEWGALLHFSTDLAAVV
ncbi:uncharacterized protein CLUP02_08745, partial [Colletotrichum lupini]